MSELRTYVEIDVDYDTTQDPPELDPPITYRFGLAAVDAVRGDIDARHNLSNVSFNPGEISLGEDLGVRTSVSVTMTDERSYDGPGTYWGRFRARHPYLTGRDFRLIQGLGDQPLAEMTTRHYVIEGFDGLKADGTFTIIAKDVFKLADGEKAQAPKASSGRLAADINSSATSLTLEPAGIGDQEYGTSGIVALSGKELCDYTRNAGSDVLNITRGQYNTQADDHKEDERVQVCIEYDSTDPADILADLLINYADIPAEYVPLQEWRDETQNKLGQVYTGLIAEPTSVKGLVSEIIQQAGLASWWDDIARLLRLQVLAGLVPQPIQLDDTNIVAGSFSSQDQPDKRLSQVWVYYGQRNALEGLENTDNYRSFAITPDPDAEAQYKQPRIRKIFSRWIPEQGRVIAEDLGERLLARFRDPPRRFQFSIFRKAVFSPVLGEGRTLDWWTLQNADGTPAPTLIEITRVAETQAVYQCQAEEVLYTAPPDVTDRVVTIENDTFNRSLRDLHDEIFSPAEAGDRVICIITAGNTVGSISTGQIALDIGDWPAGVTIVVQIRGRIQGMGGKGGAGQNGGVDFPSGATAGEAGGVALYTRVAVSLDASQGELWGGAGGGAGGNITPAPTNVPEGQAGSGGGGAGTLAGQGGQSINFPAPGTGGEDGTSEAGGAGGTGEQGGPPGNVAHDGADGGGPGLPGGDGTGPDGVPGSGQSGGAAGAAIDGASLVTLGTYDASTKTFTPGATGTEDIRGPEIN